MSTHRMQGIVCGTNDAGWGIGIAVSDDLVEWRKVGEVPQEQECERNGICAPGVVSLKRLIQPHG